MREREEKIAHALKVMNLPDKISLNSLRAKFLELSKLHHPDKNTNCDGEKFTKIKASYDLLFEEIASRKINVKESNKISMDSSSDHIDQFYDGWWGNIK